MISYGAGSTDIVAQEEPMVHRFVVCGTTFCMISDYKTLEGLDKIAKHNNNSRVQRRLEFLTACIQSTRWTIANAVRSARKKYRFPFSVATSCNNGARSCSGRSCLTLSDEERSFFFLSLPVTLTRATGEGFALCSSDVFSLTEPPQLSNCPIPSAQRRWIRCILTRAGDAPCHTFG